MLNLSTWISTLTSSLIISKINPTDVFDRPPHRKYRPLYLIDKAWMRTLHSLVFLYFSIVAQAVDYVPVKRQLAPRDGRYYQHSTIFRIRNLHVLTWD
ncbi:MAG: hypothetical protein ABI045_04545 [Flavobacteriales bacterium]